MTPHSWPDSRLCDLLGIEVPIVQAPMAGFSTPDMALAVRDAGGLGSLACAPLDAGQLADGIAKLAQPTVVTRGVGIHDGGHAMPGARQAGAPTIDGCRRHCRVPLQFTDLMIGLEPLFMVASQAFKALEWAPSRRGSSILIRPRGGVTTLLIVAGAGDSGQ